MTQTKQAPKLNFNNYATYVKWRDSNGYVVINKKNHIIHETEPVAYFIEVFVAGFTTVTLLTDEQFIELLLELNP